MDPKEILKWLEDEDEILASVQLNIAVIIDQRRKKQKHGGSTIGRREINRNWLEGHQRLYNDYFADEPTYPENIFRQRFRMRRLLFLKIVNDVSKDDIYFLQKRDAAGCLGFSPLQKVAAAFRMLAYGYSADSLDEYLRMSEHVSFFFSSICLI
jgi:hypothetical protein